jgi:hypothetical protein
VSERARDKKRVREKTKFSGVEGHRILKSLYRIFTEARTEFLQVVHDRHFLIIYSFAKQIDNLFEDSDGSEGTESKTNPDIDEIPEGDVILGEHQVEDEEEEEEEKDGGYSPVVSAQLNL